MVMQARTHTGTWWLNWLKLQTPCLGGHTMVFIQDHVERFNGRQTTQCCLLADAFMQYTLHASHECRACKFPVADGAPQVHLKVVHLKA
jgi:hypothetical protein